MSRSNPNESLTNPATKFIEWSGDKGEFKYYDKEKKEQVFIKLPFSFIVLDTLSTCKGFDDGTQMGYYSNEIRNTKTDILTVRNKKGIVFTGLYENAKEKLGSKGLKYYQSVYVAIKEGKTLVLANLQLGGSGLSPFIEFSKENKVTEIAVIVKTSTPKKKGKSNYFEPNYEVMPVSEATNKVATALDVELQEYLKAYLAKNASTVATDKVETDQDNGLNDKPKAAAKKSEVKMEEETDDLVLDNNSEEDEDAPF